MAKTRKSAKPVVSAIASKESEKKPQREDLCLSALRLTPEEREAIHKAAVPGDGTEPAHVLGPARE